MKSVSLQGKVIDGIGASTKWMPKYLPHMYPGTLNVQLTEVKWNNIIWEQEVSTHYGKPAKYSRCQINGIDAYVVMPPLFNPKKTPYLIELGHEKKLRDLLGLNNGDVVTVTFKD